MGNFNTSFGNKVINGSSQAESIFGLAGNDIIFAMEGDDIVNGNENADILNGNQGKDLVRGGQDDDLVRGGKDDDLLYGDKGDDSVYGDLGDDTGYGGVGDDLLFGDRNIGTDFSIDGDDDLFGGQGNDSIFGEGGEDLINGNEGEDIINGNEGNDLVRGGQNDDLVHGGKNNDLLFGDKGNDTVYGDLGDDTAIGGEGDDLLYGDRNIDINSSLDGNDVLFGGQGNDTIWGLGGDDIINGNENSDLLYGNKGQDTIRGGQGKDTIWGGQDNDLLYGDKDNDVLWGDLGADSLSGGSGDDVFVIGRRDDVPGFRTTGGLNISNADYIADFGDGLDLIGLSGGLTFDDLNIFQGSGENAGNTLIQDKGTGEFLVNLKGVNTNTITKANFTYSTIRIDSYLQFSQPTYRVREDGRPETLVTVTRTGSLEEAVSAIAFLTDGTTKAASDYNATPIQVNFAAGETAKTLIIPIVSDSITEGDETFNIALGFPSNGATVASPKVANVTIVDSNSTSLSNAGTLQLSNPLYGVSEDGTPFSLITVTRSGGSSGAVSVRVLANGGSAIGSAPPLASPTDFSNNPILVSWTDGDTAPKVITIPILDDTIIEGNESVSLTLSDPTGGATIGSQNSAILTIVDNDFSQSPSNGQPGNLSFTAASYSDNEGSGSTPNKIVATIQRTGGSDGVVSVQMQIDNPPGTATDGSDYINISPITITFEKGEISRNVNIPIVGDLNVESDETINLKLVNPIGGATLGTQQTATYTIKNDDSTPTINTPEIDVLYGDTTVPDDTGNANFGTTTVGTPVTKSFTVKNLGNANLTLGAINSLPTGFTLVSPFGSTTLTVGSTTSFDVKLDATNIGSYNGTISFANNDTDENPYNFNISGTINTKASDAEIQVLDSSIDIVDGTTTPINFGTTTLGVPIIKTFTVKNLGSTALNLSGWTLPTGFSVVGNLPGSIGVGSSATFDLKLEATAGGNYQGNIAIGNNDSNENPFDFAVAGTVTPVPPTSPEIQVLDVNTDINDGTTTPINFGTTSLGVPITKTFTVKNLGGAALNLSNWSVPNGFSFIGTIPGIVGNGGSTTFQVKFDANTAGTTQGTLTVGNNDSDENPFDFAIAATVSGTPASNAEIQVLDEQNNNVTDGTTTINFGTTAINAPITKTFTVKNTGTEALNLTQWKLSDGFSFVNAVPGIVIPGGSATFRLRFDAASAGTTNGTIEINNNDGDGGDGIENPFDFAITGTVTGTQTTGNPEIEVKDGVTNITDGSTTPIDFGPTDLGVSKSKTFTINNTGIDTLTLSGWNLPKGFSLVGNIPGSVAPGQSKTFEIRLDANQGGEYKGSLEIGNNDADGGDGVENPFDFTIAGTVFPLPPPNPEIDVFAQPNNKIVNGTETPINFGNTPVGTSVNQTFTINNSGTDNLTLGTLSLPTGFSVVSSFGSTTIEPNKSTTFTVKLDANSAGNYTGTILFTNNDADLDGKVENPFYFPIAGTVQTVPAPEIVVLDTSSSTPNILDGTPTPIDIGSTPLNLPKSKPFIVINTGNADLSMTNWKLSNGFSFVGTPPSTIAPGGSATFNVQLDGQSVGNVSGKLEFDNNDGDGGDGVENPFDFQIQGTVNPPLVTITKSGTDFTENFLFVPRFFTINLEAPAPTGGIMVNFDMSGATVGQPTGNDYTVSGTGITTSGTTGSINIPAGAKSANLPVNIIDDFTTKESNETVIITLTSATGGFNIGTPNSAQNKINDNDWDGQGTINNLNGGTNSDKIQGNDNNRDNITPSGGADTISWVDVPPSTATDVITGYAPGEDNLQFTKANYGNISSVSSVAVTTTGASGTDINGKNLIVFDASINFTNVTNVESTLVSQKGNSGAAVFFIYTSGGNRFLGYDPNTSGAATGNAVNIGRFDSDPVASNFIFV